MASNKIGTKLILAVVGMAGSGKGEATKYLKAKLNAPNVYFGEPTFERIKKEGLELTYANERKVREMIRKEIGMDAYAKLSLPMINEYLKTNDVVLVESLYSWQEYKLMKEQFVDKFMVLAIFASPEIRFQRLVARKQDTGKDRVRIMRTKDEFDTRDYTELENLAKGGPIARADFTIINESNLEDFHRQLDSIIRRLNISVLN